VKEKRREQCDLYEPETGCFAPSPTFFFPFFYLPSLFFFPLFLFRDERVPADALEKIADRAG